MNSEEAFAMLLNVEIPTFGVGQLFDERFLQYPYTPEMGQETAHYEVRVLHGELRVAFHDERVEVDEAEFARWRHRVVEASEGRLEEENGYNGCPPRGVLVTQPVDCANLTFGQIVNEVRMSLLVLRTALVAYPWL